MLSQAETPPFPIEDDVDVDEELRLVHRYVDLRRPRMARILRARAQVVSIIRRVMERHGFLDVETPMLTRATPEGARDFLVPSRLQPGEIFALPQSPQLFKQLLRSPASSATTRSPAASGTRTCAPTASPSSPSSTSRCPSPTRRTSSP